MVKSYSSTSECLTHQYLVVGSHVATENNPNPKIYKMRIFATDEIRAKSKFWYFLRRLNKIKKANGQILSCSEVFEKDPSKVKTFGIVCTYKSKFGYHTLYKEYRSVSLNRAVDQLYSEMAGRHKAQKESVTIVRTTVIDEKTIADSARRNYTKQIVRDNVRFPILSRLIRSNNKSFRNVFRANRPSLFA